ncbi:MAG TPA: hypothetical protein VHB79_37305 [Polyangiaceae bacterium]|nr:hypothetical protein [Polyangiaceae bacterium]
MRRRLSLRILAALLAMTTAAGAERRTAPASPTDPLGPWVPDFAKLQSGGFSGTFTVGVGYAPLHDLLNVAVLYGYVPAALGGSVHSLHFTLQVRPLSFSSHGVRWLPAYAGLGALCTWGADYFLVPPDRYPDDYYPPNACHASAHVGVELQWLPRRGLARAHGLYAELTTIDTLIIDYFQNPRVTAPADVISSSIGYRLAL